MANYFTRFLSQAVTGVLNPKGVMANWQHATRLFVDNNYRLMPRSKFLYYVRFEFDKTALVSQVFKQKHADEIGYLIKTADLPKYNIDSQVMNQYNRKKIVYKMLNYDPVNLTFHDDTLGIINALWAIYYGYYFNDRNNPNEAYSATHYRGKDDDRSIYRYGMDSDKTVDLLKSVSIYTMSRRRFNGYTLVNPRIKSWQHDSGDYDTSEYMTHTMQLEYEAVQYSTGNVKYGSPKGFATLYYDTIPSPLSIAGGGTASLLGEGGVLDGLESIFGDVSSGSTFGSVGGFINTAIKAVNLSKNIDRLDFGKAIKDEGLRILTSPSTIRGAVNGINGLNGTVIPRSGNTTTNTTATAVARQINNRTSSAPVYTGNDEIVRARLGLPPIEDSDFG